MNIVIDTCNEMKYYIDYEVRNKVRTVKGPKLPTWGDEIAYLKNTIDACIALKHEEFEEIKKVLETNQKNSYIKELVDTYSEFIESINEINQETKKSLFYAHDSKDFNASLKRNEYSIFTVNNTLQNWIWAYMNYTWSLNKLKKEADIEIQDKSDEDISDFNDFLSKSGLDEETKNRIFKKKSANITMGIKKQKTAKALYTMMFLSAGIIIALVILLQ